jgi:subtilisin family serine protease
MKKILLLLIFTCSFLLGSDLKAQEFNSYIIQYKGTQNELINKISVNGIGITKAIAFAENKDFKDKYSFLSNEQSSILQNFDNYYNIQVSNQSDLSKIISYLKNDKNFISITPNYIFKIDTDNTIPNDSLFQSQWYLKAINADRLSQNYTGKGIIIGLIDTGIDFTHPDLENNLWVNTKEDINKNGKFDPWLATEIRNGITGDLNDIDDDKNGIIDDVIGYDFVDQSVVNIGDYSNPDPIPEDQGEHGTLVAGVISAVRNNQIGIAGIASNSKILTAKAFDVTGNAESDDIARAILYAVMNGAKVLNFSFGEQNESPIVYDAIKFASSMGCVMIGSSGNNGWNFQHYPSDHPEVISVGGVDESLRISGKTNYGSMLDITAPSTNIMTTNVGGGYKFTAGTSLSAPMVTALAAMMLEKNPMMTPAAVRGTIQMAARREFSSTWSIYYGAGILDVNKTLESTGTSTFEITSPTHQLTINKDIESLIQINGTVASTLFDSYDIALGKDILPTSWVYESEKIKTQVLNGNLAKLNIKMLDEGVYTLSLRVYKKNLNIIERRIYIRITSSKSKVQLTNFNQLDAYYNDKRVVVIGAVTDRKCNMLLKYSESGNPNTKITRQFDLISNFHTIILGEEITPEVEYEAEAIFFTNENDSIFHKFKFTRKNDIFLTTNLVRKSYSIPRTYLLNKVSDLYGNGQKHLAVNDLSNLFIGDSRIYEFDNNKFSLKDTSAEGWIPAGIGDSNGDGIPEIFGTADGMSTIKQSKSTGESPYSKELFRSAIDSTFWAEKIFDLDDDGIDEIIGYKYDGQFRNYYAVYKFINGKYQLITRAELPDLFKDYSLTRGSAIADFDGDGKYELVFANTRGNLFIYEFRDNKLNFEYLDTEPKSSSVQFIESPDTDGDGKPEIMHAYAGSVKLYKQNEVGTPLWSVRLIKSTAKDTYTNTVWNEDVYGVRLGATRQGVFYRNGSAKGDLDGDGKDEIILSLFPNLYVWTYDTQTNGMKPFWYYPSTFSNSAVVYDFDGNGTNEIGISTFSNTSFFEFDKNFAGPGAPKNFDGWAKSTTSAYFKWDSVANAKEYALFLVDRTKNPPQAIEQARTSETELLLTNMKSNQYYEFVLASFNKDLKDNFSDFTEIVEIYTNPLTKVESVSKVSNENLILKFKGKLKGNFILPELFTIFDTSNNPVTTVKSAVIISENTVLISYNNTIPAGNYLLKILPFRDYYGNYTEEEFKNFEVIINQKEDEIYLLSLEVLSETLLRLRFSEKVFELTAEDTLNYRMSPIGRVINAELDQTDHQNVLLNLSQEIRKDGSRGKNYSITVTFMVSDSMKLMTTGSGNTLGFVLSNESLREIYVYPNPIRKSQEPEIYFANLTNRATVTIMTSDGAEIITLTESDGNGGVEWNGRDKQGNYLPTGVYLYKVSGTNSKGTNVFEETSKFVIIP